MEFLAKMGDSLFSDGEQKKTIEELIALNEDVLIDLDVDLDGDIEVIEKELKKLRSKVNGSKIVVNVTLSTPKEYLYSEQEIANLKKVYKICKDNKFNSSLRLGNVKGTYEQFIIARDKIEEFGKKLSKIKVNNRPLSVGEKFVAIYSFVANRIYKQGEDNWGYDDKGWIGVLSGNKVICSGFASALKMMCDRFFTKEELACFEQNSYWHDRKTENGLGGHVNNLIYINDKVYDYRAIRYCDTSWDSLNEKSRLPTFLLCMLPLDMMNRYVNAIPIWDSSLYIYDVIGNREKDNYITRHDIDFNLFIEKLSGQKSVVEVLKLFNEKIKNEQVSSSKIQEARKKAIKMVQNKTIEYVKPLMLRQDLPKDMLKNGIYAAGLMLGLNEKDALKYSEDQIALRESIHDTKFLKENVQAPAKLCEKPFYEKAR